LLTSQGPRNCTTLVASQASKPNNSQEVAASNAITASNPITAITAINASKAKDAGHGAASRISVAGL
jgi:hypothetical protein